MTSLPQGLSAGTWNIDAAHSTIGFTVRHGGVSKTRGKFDVIAGSATLGDTFESLSVTTTADPKTINTGNETRDEHLKSGDFFQTEEHPEIVFKSTAVEDFDGSEFTLKGELTLLGVTKEVVFDAEFLGANEDPNGNQITGVSATAKINRKDFGMSFNATMPGGDLMVSDKVNLEIDVELVKA